MHSYGNERVAFSVMQDYANLVYATTLLQSLYIPVHWTPCSIWLVEELRKPSLLFSNSIILLSLSQLLNHI